MEESLRRHADEQAAVELRAYVVVPLPCRGQPDGARRAGRPATRAGSAGAAADARRCRRTGARCARARRTSTRCAPSSRRSGCRSASSTASRCCALLWARFNPTSADRGPRAGATSDGRGARRARHRARARAGAPRPRWRCASAIAGSSLDFTRARHARRGRRATSSRTIYAARTAQQTTMGWLHGRDADPPAVHAERVRARARPPPRAPEDQARLPAAVRDQPRRRAARPRARLRPLRPGARVRGAARRDGRPRPRQRLRASPSTRRCAPAARTRTSPRSARRSTTASSSSSRRRTARSTAASSASPSCGPARCRSAATSPAARASTRPRNVGDTVPLVGTACGSPTGIPFAFADPGRTVERLNPYDPEHANHTLLICGKGGSGKTMTANVHPRRARSRSARARS